MNIGYHVIICPQSSRYLQQAGNPNSEFIDIGSTKKSV